MSLRVASDQATMLAAPRPAAPMAISAIDAGSESTSGATAELIACSSRLSVSLRL